MTEKFVPTVIAERLPVTTSPGMEVLDATAGASVQGAMDALLVWERMRPMVAEYMETVSVIIEKQIAFSKGYNPAAHDDFVREVHATISGLFAYLDKLSRVTMAFSKAADNLARLAKFLNTGGRTDDLTTKSVAELARIVQGAARLLNDD